MSNDLEKSHVFKHPVNGMVLAGGAILVLVACILAVLKGNDWIFAALFSSIVFCFYLALARAKLEIHPDGLVYRGPNLKGSRSAKFGEVEKIHIQEDRRADVPVAAFWVQLRDGRRWQLALQLFPVRASALLLAQLDRHAVPIAPPDSFTAQTKIEEIRKAQAEIF